MLTALLLAVLQSPTPAFTTGPDGESRIAEADSAALATAYADPTARELVRLARAHHEGIDASVFRYHALARQHLSVGLRAFFRDRLVYRRETVSEVFWRRDGQSRVEVKGAREAVPIALKGVRVPDDLGEWAEDFVPQPGSDRLWVSVSDDDDGFAWHPLVENGESVYRYATGDTTIIRLPDGKDIRLVELRVTPRLRDIRLITGVFWIDLDTHAIVQAAFRPSREFDLDRDLALLSPGDADDADEVPGFLKPIRFDVRYISVEYGLWESRWWMPRLMAFDGYVQMGPARFPVTMEVAYSDYTVEGDPAGLPELPPVIRDLAGDTTDRPEPYTYGIAVVVPEDDELLDSPLLAESFYAGGEALIDERQIEELGRRLADLPAPPWEVGTPRVTWPWSATPGLVRYNRVEGLSLGARVDWDLTRLRTDGTIRYGTADGKVTAELGVESSNAYRTWRLAGYHRLATADPGVRAFGFGNSLHALILGRDDGSYFRASGAELTVTPAPGGGHYDVRFYAEHQDAVGVNTDFSLRHWARPSHVFRQNIEASEADQVGVAARVGLDRGLDPNGFRWGAWLDVTAETGTFTFLRPGIGLRAGAPLPGPFVGVAEVAGGTTAGSTEAETGGGPAPVQSRWFLGGPTTVRGFDGGYRIGRDYLRGRLEVATDLPAARLALFSDAGWAGTFPVGDTDDVLVSAGVGVSFLDGLVRLDLARTLQPIHQWRLDFYADALF